MKLTRPISLVLLCITFFPSLAFGDPLTYLAEGNIVTITNCETSASGELVIPSTYGGMSIVSIGDYAFYGCSSLTSVTILDSITSIGVGAFFRCTSLTRFVFGGNAPSTSGVGFDTVSNDAKIFITPDVTGFGETFEGPPVIILEKLEIKSFNNHATPFSLTFETKSGSTYIIEASHDLKNGTILAKSKPPEALLNSLILVCLSFHSSGITFG